MHMARLLDELPRLDDIHSMPIRSMLGSSQDLSDALKSLSIDEDRLVM